MDRGLSMSRAQEVVMLVVAQTCRYSEKGVTYESSMQTETVIPILFGKDLSPPGRA